MSCQPGEVVTAFHCGGLSVDNGQCAVGAVCPVSGRCCMPFTGPIIAIVFAGLLCCMGLFLAGCLAFHHFCAPSVEEVAVEHPEDVGHVDLYTAPSHPRRVRRVKVWTGVVVAGSGSEVVPPVDGELVARPSTPQLTARGGTALDLFDPLLSPLLGPPLELAVSQREYLEYARSARPSLRIH